MPMQYERACVQEQAFYNPTEQDVASGCKRRRFVMQPCNHQLRHLRTCPQTAHMINAVARELFKLMQACDHLPVRRCQSPMVGCSNEYVQEDELFSRDFNVCVKFVSAIVNYVRFHIDAVACFLLIARRCSNMCHRSQFTDRQFAMGCACIAHKVVDDLGLDYGIGDVGWFCRFFNQSLAVGKSMENKLLGHLIRSDQMCFNTSTLEASVVELMAIAFPHMDHSTLFCNVDENQDVDTASSGLDRTPNSRSSNAPQQPTPSPRIFRPIQPHNECREPMASITTAKMSECHEFVPCDATETRLPNGNADDTDIFRKGAEASRRNPDLRHHVRRAATSLDDVSLFVPVQTTVDTSSSMPRRSASTSSLTRIMSRLQGTRSVAMVTVT